MLGAAPRRSISSHTPRSAPRTSVSIGPAAFASAVLRPKLALDVAAAGGTMSSLRRTGGRAAVAPSMRPLPPLSPPRAP